jgi:macrolide-specific efflux system membrane fusion protein
MSMKWWTENLSTTNTNSVKRKNTRAIAIVLGLSLLMGASGCALLPDEMQEEDIPTITPPKLAEKPTYTVSTETIETKVRGSGKIMSTKEETLFFISENGRVKGMHVEIGQQVAAGELIAELDVTELENNLRQQRLQFRSEELNMKQTLRKADEMTEEELEQAKINFELKRTALVELEEKIARARLTAPFDGTVVGLHKKPGDTVQAYETVAVLADMTKLTVAVNMSKDNLKNIAVGMETEVDINANGSHKGEVLRLPVASNDQNNGGYDPWNPNPVVQVDSPDKYLLIQLESFPEGVTRDTPLSAAVVIERKEQAVVIPPSSLRTYGGRTYVQVMEKDGTKREVDVEVGQQTATQVEIRKGLEPGMKVVGR